MRVTPFPEDVPGWTCCGEPGCRFAAKCADIERLDRAYLKASGKYVIQSWVTKSFVRRLRRWRHV